MISYERNGTALPLPSGDQRVCLLRQAMYSMIVLFHFLQPLLLSAAVARSVIRRLESFGASLRVFDNFNGAESPWVRLVALLDLSETRPLSASADSPKIGIADTKMGDRYRSPSDFSLIFLTVEYERMHRHYPPRQEYDAQETAYRFRSH